MKRICNIHNKQAGVKDMWKELKELTKLTRTAKGQSVGMQRKLYLYWISMILTVFAVVILVLSLTGVFNSFNQKLNHALAVQHNNNKAELTNQIERLTAEGILASEETSKILQNLLYMQDVSSLNNDPAGLLKLEETVSMRLEMILKASSCNGVYFVVDATTNTSSEKAEHSRAGVYLRYANLSKKDAVDQDTTLYRGMADVARENYMELHNRWNLEFDTDFIPGFETIMKQNYQRVADGCLWTEKMNLPDTWENLMMLTVPVLHNDGSVQGICGIELSNLYFRLSYPAYEYEYGNMVTLLAPVENQKVEISRGLAGCLDGTYLKESDTLEIEEGKLFNTYIGESGKYYGMQTPLNMKMQNGSTMYAITLIPSEDFDSAKMLNNTVWSVASLLLLISMLAMAFLLSRNFVKPISDSLASIMEQSQEKIQSSGITEIDEVMGFLQEQAKLHEKQEQIELDLPLNMEELFQEFVERVVTLTPTERTILQYYIDGYSIEEVADMACISINTAKKHNTNVNRKLCVKSREELALYIDLFRRSGRISDISYIR